MDLCLSTGPVPSATQKPDLNGKALIILYAGDSLARIVEFHIHDEQGVLNNTIQKNRVDGRPLKSA